MPKWPASSSSRELSDLPHVGAARHPPEERSDHAVIFVGVRLRVEDADEAPLVQQQSEIPWLDDTIGEDITFDGAAMDQRTLDRVGSYLTDLAPPRSRYPAAEGDDV